jgi:hypothetical protein
MPVPRTTRARATAAPRTARPVALTPRQGKRHLWQVKRASFHLRHDDHVKKGVPHHLNSYPFPLPLSLSCYRDGKGDISKGILLHEGSGPRALLLIRGSKAGPSEGFDSRPRALGLQAHYLSRIRRLAPRKGSTAAPEHVERGMTLAMSVTWPRLGLCSRGTLGHFRDQ